MSDRREAAIAALWEAMKGGFVEVNLPPNMAVDIVIEAFFDAGPPLYRVNKMTHNDVREAAELLGMSTACMVWAIDILRERLIPLEVDSE